MSKKRLLCGGFVALALHGLLLPAGAALLDWSTLTAPTLPSGPGSSSTVYEDVTFLNGVGVDVTLTYIAVDPGAGSFTSIESPALLFERTATSEWGARTRFDSSTGLQYITHVLTFSVPVNNVTFSIWDVDRASWQDELRNLTAITSLGGTIFPGSVTTTAGDITIVGSSTTGWTATADDGADNPPSTDPSADVTINFGSTYITEFRFDYGNGPAVGSGNNPATQLIYLSGVRFDPIPEVGSALGAFALVFATVARRRRDATVG